MKKFNWKYLQYVCGIILWGGSSYMIGAGQDHYLSLLLALIGILAIPTPDLFIDTENNE